jgi:hypothetical protein
MDRIGALFGAIASKSYDAPAAFDIGKMSEDVVKGLLEHVGGLLLKGAEAAPVISIPVEAGKKIVFAFASERRARDKAARELAKAKTEQQRRETFTRILGGTLEHLAYVSLLADPATRTRLGVKLHTDSLPRKLPNDPVFRNSGINTVREWQAEVFPNGVLQVPDPSDEKKWELFLAWARYANPQLASTANELRDTMHRSFHDQILGSL